MSVFRSIVLCGALGGALLLASPAAAATYLINPGLDAVGPSGPSVTTVAGGPEVPSAALGWLQFTAVPGGTLTTTLLPTTDPWGSGNMLHIVTDSGDYPPAKSGNGFGQQFVGGARLVDATVSFDIDVVSGSVTGGISADTAAHDIGVFTSHTPTFGPTNGWIRVVNVQLPGVLSDGVFFETLTIGQGAGYGANYYVDNVAVTAAPEPPTWAMLLAGFAGLEFVGQRRARKAALPFAGPRLGRRAKALAAP
jgi:hypothetical protein